MWALLVGGCAANMAHKKRFASEVIKRFETGIEGFSQNAATAQHDALSGELAKLAQCWQSYNAPELALATDDLFALYQRAFNRAAPAPAPLRRPPIVHDRPPPRLKAA